MFMFMRKHRLYINRVNSLIHDNTDSIIYKMIKQRCIFLFQYNRFNFCTFQTNDEKESKLIQGRSTMPAKYSSNMIHMIQINHSKPSEESNQIEYDRKVVCKKIKRLIKYFQRFSPTLTDDEMYQPLDYMFIHIFDHNKFIFRSHEMSHLQHFVMKEMEKNGYNNKEISR
jgi:translation initiation factor 2 beta subunit (eIF-2beta)/eIF-5